MRESDHSLQGGSGSTISESPLFAGDPLFTVAEVAAALKVSENHVRRMFRHEPGVLNLGVARYDVLRIPQSVLDRMHQRRTRGAIGELQARRRRIK